MRAPFCYVVRMPTRVQYDPASGKEYTATIRMAPEDAAKLIDIAAASRLSIRQTLATLVRATEVDAAGRSVDIERQLAAEQEAEAKARRERRETSLF